MNEKVLRTLEYNKIIDLLVQKADSEPGKNDRKNSFDQNLNVIAICRRRLRLGSRRGEHLCRLLLGFLFNRCPAFGAKQRVIIQLLSAFRAKHCFLFCPVSSHVRRIERILVPCRSACEAITDTI